MTGVIMSFGKVQESLAQNVNDIQNSISIQQEVQKREIKLLKKERFYELTERSNIYQKSIRNMNSEDNKRFMELSMIDPDNVTIEELINISKEKNELVRKSINENYDKFQEPTSFKNDRFGELMENINNLDTNVKYKFETNNNLFKISHYVKLNKIDIENMIELDFYINKIDYPNIGFIDVNDLTYLKVIEEGKTYLYNITKYIGYIFDGVYRFEATIEKNGEYLFNMEREDVILDKNNTMSHKNYKIGD